VFDDYHFDFVGLDVVDTADCVAVVFDNDDAVASVAAVAVAAVVDTSVAVDVVADVVVADDDMVRVVDDHVGFSDRVDVALSVVVAVAVVVVGHAIAAQRMSMAVVASQTVACSC